MITKLAEAVTAGVFTLALAVLFYITMKEENKK